MTIEVTYIDHMGSDLSVVNAARVSFKKTSSELTDKDVKLIHYLAKHKHTSPFGHAFASFHIKAPVFVARQLVKHKFLRWNEVSRRYVDDEPEFFEPEIFKARPENKKQGAGEALENRLQDDCWFELTSSYHTSLAAYNNLLARGVAPEQARIVLPQSMMTEWYWSGSLDAFADMCNLRCYPDAQAETKIVADQIDKIMSNLYPHSWEALRA